MKTIAAFKMALDVFSRLIKDIKAESEEGYKVALSDATTKMADTLKQLRSIDSIMVPIKTMDESTFSLEESTALFQNIIECGKQRKQLSVVFTGAYTTQIIQRCRFVIPEYVNFEETPHVLIEHHRGWEDFAVRMMNQIAFGCLLSLPLGKVRINFVNPSFSNKACLFSGTVSSEICRTYIERREIDTFIDSLTNRLMNKLKEGPKGIEGLPDYEIVFLLDYPYMFEGITEQMKFLNEQGSQAGIHFIVLENSMYSFENKRSYDILKHWQLYARFNTFYGGEEEDYDTKITSTYELTGQPELLKLCFELLNGSIEGVTSCNVAATHT